MWLKDDKLRYMFRQTAHEARPLQSHNIGAHTLRKIYKIPTGPDAPIGNIPNTNSPNTKIYMADR